MKRLRDLLGPYGGAAVAVAVGVGATAVPGWHVWATSWLVGALVGGVNVLLMARGLKRGVAVVLAPGGAVAVAASGIVRFLVVAGLLVGIGAEMRTLAPAALLGGYFVPEGTFIVHVLRREQAAVPKGDVE